MKTLILLLFLFSPVEAQTFKWYPIERDYLDSEHGSIFKYDKVDHFTSHALLTLIIPTKKYNLDLWLSVTAGLLYEVRDGYQWKRSGGFSCVDFIADVSGAIAGMWIKDLCHSLGVYVLINRDGISINL